jgi:cobalamin biosynthesis protein CbiG
MVERVTSVADKVNDDSMSNEQQNNKMNFKFFKNQEIPEFFYNLETDIYQSAPTTKA